MHVKRQILHLVHDALVQHLPGHAVHLDRVDPVPASRLPAVLIRESEAGGGIRPFSTEGHQQRTLLVAVSQCVAQANGYGDAADAIGLQVEQLFGADPQDASPLMQQLHGLCPMGIELQASRMFLSGEGETAIAVLMHTWKFTYVVHPAAPDVAIT
jgi:hypothetical protein